MNMQSFIYSKLLTKVNKSLADELNQPTSFAGKFFTNHPSTVHSNKKATKKSKNRRVKILKGFFRS